MQGIVELAEGGARLRFAPALGGRVIDLRLTGRDGAPRDILVPFPVDARPRDLLDWPKGGIYPLLPYGNRIRDAKLRFESQEYLLPSHPAAHPHTLHGHGHRVSWRLVRCEGSLAEWQLDHAASEQWPWSFVGSLSAELTPTSVVFRLGLRNTGEGSMPAGIGLHPYLVHDVRNILTFHAPTEWPTTPDLLADPPEQVRGAAKFEQSLPTEPVTLYRSGWDGTFEIRRFNGEVILLQADATFGHLVVHQPGGAQYLCVEPTSHAPDGFNMTEAGIQGAGRVILQPGLSLQGAVHISLEA